MSLKRIGWHFHTPLVLKNAEGTEFNLTALSPALLAYHLNVDWKRRLGVRAGAAIGAPEGEQVDPTVCQKVMTDLSPRNRALVRAYVTQAVWSQSRLHSCGYDVAPACIHCGARDTLYHRLWECGFTESPRADYMTADDLEWIRYHPRAHELLQGLQLLPYLPDDRPTGLGHEGDIDSNGNKHMECYTINGTPLEHFLHGVLFLH